VLLMIGGVSGCRERRVGGPVSLTGSGQPACDSQAARSSRRGTSTSPTSWIPPRSAPMWRRPWRGTASTRRTDRRCSTRAGPPPGRAGSRRRDARTGPGSRGISAGLIIRSRGVLGNAANLCHGFRRVSERGPGDPDRLRRFLSPPDSRRPAPAKSAFAAGCLVGRSGGNETPAPGVGGRFDGTGGRLGRRCSTVCSDEAAFLRLAPVCRLKTTASLPFVMRLALGQCSPGWRGFCPRES
jgi:hypothetical protein